MKSCEVEEKVHTCSLGFIVRKYVIHQHQVVEQSYRVLVLFVVVRRAMWYCRRVIGAQVLRYPDRIESGCLCSCRVRRILVGLFLAWDFLCGPPASSCQNCFEPPLILCERSFVYHELSAVQLVSLNSEGEV
jgi:hypothetical protein